MLSQSTVNLRPSVRPLVYPIKCGFSRNWKSWGSLCGSVWGHVSLHACFIQCKTRSGKKSSLFNSSHTRASISIGVHSAHSPHPHTCSFLCLVSPRCQPVFPTLLRGSVTSPAYEEVEHKAEILVSHPLLTPYSHSVASLVLVQSLPEVGSSGSPCKRQLQALGGARPIAGGFRGST